MTLNSLQHSKFRVVTYCMDINYSLCEIGLFGKLASIYATMRFTVVMHYCTTVDVKFGLNKPACKVVGYAPD